MHKISFRWYDKKAGQIQRAIFTLPEWKSVDALLERFHTFFILDCFYTGLKIKLKTHFERTYLGLGELIRSPEEVFAEYKTKLTTEKSWLD